MTSSENLCKKAKRQWQIVDNQIFKNIEDARDYKNRYLNKGVNCYVETIGNGFKLVVANCYGLDETNSVISSVRKKVKEMKRNLEIISIE